MFFLFYITVLEENAQFTNFNGYKNPFIWKYKNQGGNFKHL